MDNYVFILGGSGILCKRMLFTSLALCKWLWRAAHATDHSWLSLSHFSWVQPRTAEGPGWVATECSVWCLGSQYSEPLCREVWTLERPLGVSYRHTDLSVAHPTTCCYQYNRGRPFLRSPPSVLRFFPAVSGKSNPLTYYQVIKELFFSTEQNDW